MHTGARCNSTCAIRYVACLMCCERLLMYSMQYRQTLLDVLLAVADAQYSISTDNLTDATSVHIETRFLIDSFL
jgi:hypothetical protein